MDRTMCRILCSTGALIGRPNGRNYRLLKDLAGQLTCDGFEFMMYDSWYDQVEELTDYLLDLKLNVPVMHCEKKIGEAISKGTEDELETASHLFEINCQIAEKLGAKKLVIHLWDGITSDQNFDNNKRTYRHLADASAAHGLEKPANLAGWKREHQFCPVLRTCQKERISGYIYGRSNGFWR